MRNTSWYFGLGAKTRLLGDDTQHLDIGASAGLMTRQDYNDNEPFIYLLPFASVGTDNFDVNITYIPKVDPKMVPILFFQLRIPVR